MVGTLKHLGYPHKAMIRIVTTAIPSDHAIAVIEMPDGEMREYDSVTSSFLDRMFYVKAVDFDENNLADKTHAINTADKYITKPVFNSTTEKFVFAQGYDDTDVWNDAVGALAHTPI